MRSKRTGILLPLSLTSVTCLLVVCTALVAALPAAAQASDKKQTLLTPDDIELIKVYEVDLDSDPPPRVAIPRDVLNRFLKEYQSDDRVPRGKQAQSKWVRGDGHKQLELMFALRARQYYKEVSVKSQIASFRAWSTLHRRYILGYFQPAFGSGAVEGLKLLPRGRESDRIEMTNYFLLTQGEVDGKLLIDRNNPEESLLVQWGLPRADAKFPAPEDLKGWRPYFKDARDPRYKELVDWVSSLVRANQGSNYGIEFPAKAKDQPDE